MTAVCHFGGLKEALNTLGTPFSTIHTKFGEDILIGGGDMPEFGGGELHLPWFHF